MQRWRDICWWCCFIAISIYVQSLAPGMDVLAVGIIILLQERDYQGMIWFLPLICFIQEGIGTRPFGSAIIWYSAVIMLFNIGRWLFEARNFIFVFMLSACLGLVYFSVAFIMALLQNITFNLADTVDKSLVQAIFMPFIWMVFCRLRPKTMENED